MGWGVRVWGSLFFVNFGIFVVCEGYRRVVFLGGVFGWGLCGGFIVIYVFLKM